MLNIKNILDITKLSLIRVKNPVPQVGYKNYSYSIDNDSILIEDGVMDFIINKEGDLLLGNGHYKLNKKEKELIFAGKVGIESGKITYIDNDSGHYAPTLDESIKFLEYFTKLPYVSKDKLSVNFK